MEKADGGIGAVGEIGDLAGDEEAALQEEVEADTGASGAVGVRNVLWRIFGKGIGPGIGEGSDEGTKGADGKGA